MDYTYRAYSPLVCIFLLLYIVTKNPIYRIFINIEIYSNYHNLLWYTLYLYIVIYIHISLCVYLYIYIII